MSRKLLRAPVALLAVLLSGPLSCSKDGATAPIILTPLTVVPSLTSAEPATAVTLTIRGLPLPTTGLAAKFNAQSVTIARLSDTTAAILVPSVAAGSGTIEVTAPGARGTVGFSVLATTPVVNPTAYLDSAVTDFTTTAADFSTSDPALSAFWTDRMNTLRTQIAALTPAERASAAAVLRQAIARLDTTGTSAFAEANAVADCDDYESCAAKIPSIEVITTRVLGGAAFIAMGVDLGAVPPPNPYTIVAGGILAGVGMHVLLETLSQTLRYGAQAIFVDFGSEAALRAAPTDTSLAARMASLTGSGTFISDSARRLIVRGRYASPSRATAASNTFAGYVISALDFLSGLWDGARAKFPALPAFRAIPATPVTSVLAPIPTKYLTLGARTPSTVSGSAQTRADSSWYLRFSLPLIGNEHPFSFIVNYSGAGARTTQETYSATLVPDTFPVATVEILNSTGVLGVQETKTIALVAVVRDSMNRVLTDRPVTWTSSVTSVATVSSSGLLTAVVTGVKEGLTTIRALAETKQATAIVLVGPVPVDTVIISPDTLPLGLGGTGQFQVTLKDSLGNVLSGRVVTWTTINSQIASVNATTGIFTGNLAGVTGITATSEGKVTRGAVRVIAAARALSSGGASAHHCAISTAGALFCWGSNSSGQLGDFTGTSRNVPVASTAATADAAQISTGAEHSCARYATGRVECWGVNDVGQLGNGTATPFEVPATVVSGGHNFAKLASAPNATCGITTAGAAYCWGVLSGGTTVVPTLVSGGHVFADISSGGIDGFCGLTTGGNILCWGQLGWETATTPYNSAAPRQVGSGRTYTKLAMTEKTQCGLSGSQIWCWGAQDAEAIGITAFSSTPAGANWTGVPFAVSGGAAFVDVVGGLRFTCGLTTTGSVWCWGPIVGVEQTVDGSVPLGGSTGVHAQGDGAKFQDRAGTGYTALAASRSTVCGLRDGGIVWCWGSNSNGQAGQGTVPGGIRPTAAPAPIEEPISP